MLHEHITYVSTILAHFMSYKQLLYASMGTDFVLIYSYSIVQQLDQYTSRLKVTIFITDSLATGHKVYHIFSYFLAIMKSLHLKFCYLCQYSYLAEGSSQSYSGHHNVVSTTFQLIQHYSCINNSSVTVKHVTFVIQGGASIQ